MLRGKRLAGRPFGLSWLTTAAGAAAMVVTVVLVAVAVGTTSVVTDTTRLPGASGLAAARLQVPSAADSVLSGSPELVAANAARMLFSSAPVVVVTIANRRKAADLADAAGLARRANAPLLVVPDRAAASRGRASLVLRATITALRARAVLAVGVAASALSAALRGVSVVTDPAALPAVGRPVRLGRVPLHEVVLLVHADGSASPAAAAPTTSPAATSPVATAMATTAAIATARAAGIRVIAVSGYDPRADPAAIAALAAAAPRRVIAIGSGFGSAASLAGRVAVAETGVQLPGGGQVLFPRRMIVALYGHPGVPGLGALGEQTLSASITRAKQMAAPYRKLSKALVIPAFEIIATVAESSPGPDGSYSYESSVASLRPWVRKATAAGMYVILDLQPGRDNFLTQAKRYAALLRLPNVGLALDPEWKLQPGQLPLHQIGHVSITEVNSVVTWLAKLTWRYRLPQKLLELHEFRLSMIQHEQRLDTKHGDLAIVINMDGQGTPSDKQQTWNAITGAAPRGVRLGWKDFFVKDHPMLTPPQTMAHKPRPVLISYQ